MRRFCQSGHASTRLEALASYPTVKALQVGPVEIRACLEQFRDLLKQDTARANSVFRQILEPITMTPAEKKGATLLSRHRRKGG